MEFRERARIEGSRTTPSAKAARKKSARPLRKATTSREQSTASRAPGMRTLADRLSIPPPTHARKYLFGSVQLRPCYRDRSVGSKLRVYLTSDYRNPNDKPP